MTVTDDAMRRLARIRPRRPADLAASDLSVNEFLLVREAGFGPLGLVFGSSVYHVGNQFRRWGRNHELEQLTRAMYDARDDAMTRMVTEAHELGADGIVGVQLDIKYEDFGSDNAEFTAIGTAVRADAPPPAGGSWHNDRYQPFTSDLSGQDFWALVQAGYAPLGLTMGNCVYHIAHRRFRQALDNIGRNAEMPQHTEALYAARELAMSRMQAEAQELGGEGIVGVRMFASAHRWGGHTTEFFALGTAIRPLRARHAIAKPRLVLPLNDR